MLISNRQMKRELRKLAVQVGVHVARGLVRHQLDQLEGWVVERVDARLERLAQQRGAPELAVKAMTLALGSVRSMVRERVEGHAEDLIDEAAM